MITSLEKWSIVVYANNRHRSLRCRSVIKPFAIVEMTGDNEATRVAIKSFRVCLHGWGTSLEIAKKSIFFWEGKPRGREMAKSHRSIQSLINLFKIKPTSLLYHNQSIFLKQTLVVCMTKPGKMLSLCLQHSLNSDFPYLTQASNSVSVIEFVKMVFNRIPTLFARFVQCKSSFGNITKLPCHWKETGILDNMKIHSKQTWLRLLFTKKS